MSIFRLPGAALTVDRSIVGGKAWSLHQMHTLGIPVPPAFVIGTDVCTRYFDLGQKLPESLTIALPEAVHWLEQASGKTFGGGERPLLVSVRSGAAISMPGMMDTVLNLGINDQVQDALSRLTGAPDFVADARRRFDAQYQDIVGTFPPSDPWQQLLGAIGAVFESWVSPRATSYRRDRKLPHSAGTAVTVQAMVYGNLDEYSGTGVLFSRDPVDGSPGPYGEWLRQGQGEEVVSGRRTPEDIQALVQLMPGECEKLFSIAKLLERDQRDVQDIEFTIESGRLWLLQTRSAKRSPAATVRLAVALQKEGLITTAEALARVKPEHVGAMLQPHIDERALKRAPIIASGKLACPGIAAGIVVTSVDEAERRASAGESIILARATTDPDDVHAMSAVAGVLTELGGATSHAAVVSRELGVPCIVGCGAASLLKLDQQAITMDAAAAKVYGGLLPIVASNELDNSDLLQLREWTQAEAGEGNHRGLAELLAERNAANLHAA